MLYRVADPFQTQRLKGAFLSQGPSDAASYLCDLDLFHLSEQLFCDD